MKQTKKYLAKRILCFMLVGCITSTSVFMSYSNALTVQAEEINGEVIRTFISIGLIVYGIGGALYTGGLTTEHALSALVGLWGGGEYIYNHFHDNGDDTYTIDSELISKILESMQDVENSTFGDSTVAKMFSGSSYDLIVKTYRKTINNQNNTIYEHIQQGSSSVSYPVVYLYEDWYNDGSDDNFRPLMINLKDGQFGTYIDFVYTVTSYRDGVFVSSSTNHGGISSTFYNSDPSIFDLTHSECANVPIFSDLESAKAFLQTGEGYEDALNYHNGALFEYGSKYTGTYSGGDITVSKAVLDGIGAKIDELNQTDKSVDEKLDELLDYINGDENGGGNGGGSGGNSDDDVIEGDSWLEKIFNVLKKILDKVKSIRRWVIADTIIDGIDLVTDLVKDVGTLVVNLVKAPVATFGTLLSQLEELNDALTVKFPFCIPWDVAFLLGLLRAEPKTPHYEIPFKFENFGIDETLVIDLERFEVVSKICRTFFTLLFCRELLEMTMKIVDMKEKEFDNA